MHFGVDARNVRAIGFYEHLGFETLEQERGRVDPDAVRRQTKTSIEPLERLSRETFLRWIDRFEMGPRVQRLPSR